MKSYKYKKYFFALQIIFDCLILILLLFSVYVIFGEITTVIECAIVFVFLVLFWIYKNKKIWLNKKVILDDKNVTFFSFHNSPHTVGDCTFDFSQITDITALWLPIIGIYGVKVRTNEYVNPFKVNYCFENYKVFCVEICKSTIKENKNVYVDKRLLEYVASQPTESCFDDKKSHSEDGSVID